MTSNPLRTLGNLGQIEKFNEPYDKALEIIGRARASARRPERRAGTRKTARRRGRAPRARV